MEKTIEHAKELMEQGWKAREDLNFELAEKLLTKAQAIFEEAEDWPNVTECLNHLAYNDKLKSMQILNQGEVLTEKALSIATSKKLKTNAVLRAVISIMDAQGNYESALKSATLLAETFSESAPKGDILQHVALFQLRTGNIEKAKTTIDTAEKLIREGWENEKEPQRSVWKAKMLLTKGLIYYNLQNIEVAKKCGEDALELATKANLKTRILQTKSLLKLLK